MMISDNDISDDIRVRMAMIILRTLMIFIKMTMITMIISLHCDTDNHDNDDI